MAAKVYLIKASNNDGDKSIAEKARRLFRAGKFARCFEKNDFTAVKVHVGENGNTTYLKPGNFKSLIDELLALKTKPFATDTTTLYVGQRHNAIDHAILAAEHGFSPDALGVPFIVADGLLGTAETAVQINGAINKEVFIAPAIVTCQSVLSIAHFTGHCAACAGGTLKTLGMGCASKKGKMKQHAALTLYITDDCTRCGQCARHCPADAITIDDVQAHINQDKCIGCAECIAVCRFGAVKCNWGQESEIFQKSIAEHALGTLKGKENKAAFFNFAVSVTKDCDCVDTPKMRSIVHDIGILASTDPVAVDAATVDLVEKTAGKKLGKLIGNSKLTPHPQLDHAERIGLGTTQYDIIEVE